MDVTPNSIEVTCFSNIRVCTWNQTNDPSHQDGFELEAGKGCAFAWPNLCIGGRGFVYDASTIREWLPPPGEHNEYWDYSLQSGLNCYVSSELGFAVVYDSQYGPTTWCYTTNLRPITRYDFATQEAELLAYNGLYDTNNLGIDALQNQSDHSPYGCKEMESPIGSRFPDQIIPPEAPDQSFFTNKRPGLGGTGYQTHKRQVGGSPFAVQECDIYPASYLGPGLRMKSNFCEKPR